MHRKKVLEFLGQENGVEHLILGAARMYAVAVYVKPGACGIEILIFQFAQCTAVHCIGEIRAEARHIKIIHAASHFFIRRKSDADGAVFYFRRLKQGFGHGHDFRDSRLVIRAQQCGSVRYD